MKIKQKIIKKSFTQNNIVEQWGQSINTSEIENYKRQKNLDVEARLKEYLFIK